MKGGPKRPIHAVATWVRRQPPKIKAFLAVVSGIAALLFLRMVVHDHDNLFVSAEAVHALGISVLIFKLTKEKTCAAVSVLPQLWVMQNTKIVEPFTAHYVFALGVARFLSCAHWVLQKLSRLSFLQMFVTTMSKALSAVNLFCVSPQEWCKLEMLQSFYRKLYSSVESFNLGKLNM
ncbi:ER lumen protein-retaining receptor erd-2.2-like isoform X2 [Fagus crenata]